MAWLLAAGVSTTAAQINIEIILKIVDALCIKSYCLNQRDGTTHKLKEQTKMSYNQAKADEYQAQFIYLSSTGETDEFSWKPCPCCKSKLGGSRHEITGRLKSGETDTDWVCIDCAMYIINGESPEDY